MDANPQNSAAAQAPQNSVTVGQRKQAIEAVAKAHNIAHDVATGIVDTVIGIVGLPVAVIHAANHGGNLETGKF